VSPDVPERVSLSLSMGLRISIFLKQRLSVAPATRVEPTLAREHHS
jgi:hypothetical protein